MRVKEYISIVVALLGAGSAFAASTKVEPFRNREKVGFLGDSISHNGHFVVQAQLYWNCMHRDMIVRMETLGRSGERAGEGLARWEWDGAKDGFDRIFVMFGMNDFHREELWATKEPADAAAAEAREKDFVRYDTDMRKLVDRLRQDGVRVVLCTPSPYCAVQKAGSKPLLGCNDALGRAAEIVRKIAAEKQVPVVDWWELLTKAETEDPDRVLCPDRVHPNAAAARLMTAELLKAMGEKGDVLAELEREAKTKEYGFAEELRALVEELRFVKFYRHFAAQAGKDLDAYLAEQEEKARRYAAKTPGKPCWWLINVQSVRKRSKTYEQDLQRAEELRRKLFMVSLREVPERGPEIGTREAAYPYFARMAGEFPDSPLFQPPRKGNRLFNSSFEIGKAGHQVFTFYPFDAIGEFAKVDFPEGDAIHGRRALRIDSTKTSGDVLYRSNNPRIGAEADTVYSVWIKADKEHTVELGVSSACYDSASTNAGVFAGNKTKVKVTTEWKRYEVTYHTVARQPLLAPSIRMKEPGVYWIDAEQLENLTLGGSPRATDYAPAAVAESAYVLDKTVYEQGEDVVPERKGRFVAIDYRSGETVDREHPFKTPRFGKFALAGVWKGEPSMPAQYAVVHTLRPYPGEGIRLGINLSACLGMPFERRQRWQGFDGMTPEEYFRLVRLGGIQMMECWGYDCGFAWPFVEREKGRFDWGVMDFTLDHLQRAGMCAMLGACECGFLLKHSGPRHERDKDWFVFKNAKRAYRDTMPNSQSNWEPSLKDCEDYMRAMARRYRGKVGAYELIGESNLQTPNADYYIEFMKRVGAVIKEEDPATKLIGITGTGDCGGDIGGWTGVIGEKGGFKYFDWLGFHPYCTPTDVSPKPAESQMENMLRLINRYSPGMGLFQGECFYICDNQSDNRGPSHWWNFNYPPSHLIRRHVIDCAYGTLVSAPLALDQYWWVGPETACNSATTDFSFRPIPYVFYVLGNTFAHFLEGGRTLGLKKFPEGLNGGLFLNRDGKQVLVVWAKLDKDACDYPIPAGAKAYDMFGNPLAGPTLHLTIDPVYIVKPASQHSEQFNTALVPCSKLEQDSYDWFERHERILREQKELDPEIVFVGDSITHFWAGRHTIGGADANERWKKAFGKWRTLNLGYGWDRIQNVLWRLDHGEMDGLKPRKIVLHIGTNNISDTKNARANTAPEIAEGTLEVIRRLHAKAPAAQIIVMAIFPREEKAGSHWRVVTAESNAILARSVKDLPYVTYLDIGSRFLETDGTLPKTMMFDFCHPSDAGYAVWADAILPLLNK